MGIKISELPQASQLTSDDVVPIVQSGDTKKISIGNVISNSHNTNQANTYSSDYINNNFNKVNVQTSQTTSTTDTYSCNYIDNKIKNEYNTNTTEGYSSNYINNKIEELTTYSTEEKVIGKWIDGKPLYRRAFIQNISSQTLARIATLSDIDNIFITDKSTTIIKDGSHHFFVPVSTYETSNNFSKFYVDKTVSNNSAMLVWIGNSTSGTLIAVVEYTKTTD